MVTTSVRIGQLELKNPLIAASGTFGFGEEIGKWYDVGMLGGICSKGITLEPRLGNATPRVAETACGMLNSVGLQNPGFDAFVKHELPKMLALGCAVIVNLAGSTIDEYRFMAERLDASDIDAIELNLSCPNVAAGCMSIGTDPEQIYAVTSAVRAVTSKQLWVKLTPNVAHIAPCAQAAAAAGADAISLINTLLGMAVDHRSRRPILANNTGGLSGPAIKPIALRMVHEVYRAQPDVPIVGLGGIMNGIDALSFMLAGSSAVQVGTANMLDPFAMPRILEEMCAEAALQGVESLADFTGALKLWEK